MVFCHQRRLKPRRSERTSSSRRSFRCERDYFCVFFFPLRAGKYDDVVCFFLILHGDSVGFRFIFFLTLHYFLRQVCRETKNVPSPTFKKRVCQPPLRFNNNYNNYNPNKIINLCSFDGLCEKNDAANFWTALLSFSCPFKLG